MANHSASELVAPVIEALQAHAQIFDDSNATREQIDESQKRLARASNPFGELLANRDGWLDPFMSFRFFASDDDDEDEEEDAFSAESEETRISLTARFDFVVRDERKFVAYAKQRLLELEHDADYIDEHAGNAVSAVGELFEIDGWDTTRYENVGLEEAGKGSHWGMTEKTLWEMNFDERDEAGF